MVEIESGVKQGRTCVRLIKAVDVLRWLTIWTMANEPCWRLGKTRQVY